MRPDSLGCRVSHTAWLCKRPEVKNRGGSRTRCWRLPIEITQVPGLRSHECVYLMAHSPWGLPNFWWFRENAACLLKTKDHRVSLWCGFRKSWESNETAWNPLHDISSPIHQNYGRPTIPDEVCSQLALPFFVEHQPQLALFACLTSTTLWDNGRHNFMGFNTLEIVSIPDSNIANCDFTLNVALFWRIWCRSTWLVSWLHIVEVKPNVNPYFGSDSNVWSILRQWIGLPEFRRKNSNRKPVSLPQYG